MTVSIVRCSAGEVAEVMAFIDQYWARGHVLANSRSLVDWQHRDGAHYNFILARCRHDGALVGVLGYIATRRYDAALAGRNTLWYALWKIRDDCGVPALGLRLIDHLVEIEPAEMLGTIGLSDTAERIFRLMRYRVGVMDQYYLPNTDLTEFRIAHLPHGPGKPPVGTGKSVAMVEFSSEELLTLDRLPLGNRGEAAPAKTPGYFARRYFNTPGHRYRVMGMRRDGQIVALTAIRCVEAEGAFALRMVDYLGEAEDLAASAPVLAEIVRGEKMEYLDLVCSGIPSELLTAAGFIRLGHERDSIVPNYFAPFVRRNMRLRFAVKTSAGKAFVLFKADADQDRPNPAS